MKRLVLLAAILSVVSAPCLAEFGLGVKLGAGQNDPKVLQENFDTMTGYNRTLTKSPAFFALEFLYETNLSDNVANKLGVKAGVDFYGQNKLEVSGLGTQEETTYAFPITVYYKHDGGIKKVSFYGGIGATFINTKFEEKAYGYYDVSESKSKAFPHISGGLEYRFSKLFALGLDLKYNISAKVEKDGFILSDRSGLNGALAARFYF
jgi:hypothetical protein